MAFERRARRAAAWIGLTLLLSAGQRPSSCSGGCGGSNGCSFDSAPRTVEFFPNRSDAAYTFHFLLGVTTAVTGPTAIPSDLFQTGASEYSNAVLDSNSEAFILDGDSSIGKDGLRASSIFDPEGLPMFHWARLPYTYKDDGPAQKILLSQAWHKPVQTVRNYDHGLCYASADFDSIFTQFFDRVAGSFSGCNSRFRQTADLTPWLRSQSASAATPIVGQPVDDRLMWDIRLFGEIISGSTCALTYHPELETRLVHGFRVVVGPKGVGHRIELSPFALLTGKDIKPIPGHPPGTVENRINGDLQSKFKDGLPQAIHSNLILPTPSGGSLVIWQNGKLVTDMNDLNLCHHDSECVDRHGPEDGCFLPDPNGETLSPVLVDASVNQAMHDQHIGACVWRLEPKRMNITPRGIEIVLIENQNDVQFDTVQMLIALKPGTAIQCSTPLPMPIPLIGPIPFGDLTASYKFKSFP